MLLIYIDCSSVFVARRFHLPPKMVTGLLKLICWNGEDPCDVLNREKRG